MVQNADIDLKDVFVPDHNKLTHAKNFQTGTNVVLEASRLVVAWMAVGVAAGAYEAALQYCLKREQFGKKLVKFQMVQEKLSRMLCLVEMMISNMVHVS
jgi:glutaryl-CoA dehydrogenase